MRNVFSAAWLLRRLVPGAHADAILGDLLEVTGSEGTAYHQLLRGTVWSLGRLRLAAYVAAVLGGAFMVALQGEFLNSLSKHNASTWPQLWGSTLAFLSGAMGLMLCFSAVNYGLRDRMTQIALACTVPWIAAVQLWWIPWVPFTAGSCFLTLATFSLLSKRSRRTFGSLIMLAAVQPIVWLGGFALLITPLAVFYNHFHVAKTLANPLAVTWLLGSYLTIVFFACVTYAKAHRYAYPTSG